MKKVLLSGILGLTMLSGLVTPVLANESSGSTAVTYGEENTYTITIPDKVNVNKYGGDNVEADITSSSANIEPGKKVSVTISSTIIDQGKIELKNGNQAVTTKVTKDNSPITKDKEVASFTGMINTSIVGGTLNFSAIQESNALAGSYTGRLDYSIAVVNE